MIVAIYYTKIISNFETNKIIFAKYSLYPEIQVFLGEREKNVWKPRDMFFSESGYNRVKRYRRRVSPNYLSYFV